MVNRIFAEQLASSLNHKLHRVYGLVGTDPLLLGESKDQITHTALQQGFDEKIDVTVDNSTDWNALFDRCQSMGLFFNKQIISLNLPENLTALLQKNLQQLIELLNDEILLILQLPKLAKATEKQVWFALLNDFVIINCQTPTIEQLPRWLANRTKAMALTIDKESVQLLCYSYENNLLALKQILQLLQLLYPDHKLTYPRVKSVVEQSSVFTPFQWIDALFEGKENRARRILQGLVQEDTQPVVLLRIVQRELMTILQLAQPQQKVELDTPLPTQNLRGAFDKLKVWQNRRAAFTQLLQRLTYRKLYQIIQQTADIERAVKQDFSADVWQQLEDLSVKICR
ncbi:DNA polymerase III delta subunit [Cricetibacter osteomyelitidis]|uniref:DNA polymerase III subunit delta n=1 Tax=Cricetibacter osteomyelitidis TaxID=1521931 RepID=A0A4V2T157_9PAST|nr:DNA polymerase III subunit delta [Cricetibacter osteomyelitidis]TCP92103.1 DNA polymerase III delta subunit [Cricetibacter osteomyelitidis]